MLEKLWRKSPNVAKIKIYHECSPWENDAILLYVNNGMGHLRIAYGKGKDGKWKSFMLLKDIPLVKWHSDENNCPTCEKLISAGYGLENSEEDVIGEVRNFMNQPYETIDVVVDKLLPVLNLLVSGYYVIADLSLYPSDGNGNFFWNQSTKPILNKGTCWIYYKQMIAEGIPKFILPSQLPRRYDENTIKQYQKRYQNGEQLRGLAYYMGDYLCGLLDGHHKAVAATLEGKEFRCLTILPAQSISSSKDQKDFAMSIGGVWITAKDLPADYNKQFRRIFEQGNRLHTEEVEKYLALESECWEEVRWPQNLLECKYPDAFTMACIEFAGDLSSERILRLLKNQEIGSKDKLEFVFKSLIGLNDIRTKTLAMKITKNEELCNLWIEAFEYLATIQSEDVEDFFIKFLINDERIRPRLTEIANEYLKQRGEEADI